eukprot:scaffold116007_cov47-Attheya_sp.AAC.1
MDATGLAAAAAVTSTSTSTRREYEGEVRDNDPCNEGSVGVTFDAESQKPQKRPSNPSGDADAASDTGMKKRIKTEGGLPVLKDNADEGALSDAGDDADSVASIESIQTIIRRKLFGNPEPPKKKKAKKKSANPSNKNLDIETIKSTGKQHADESTKSSSSDQEVSAP